MYINYQVSTCQKFKLLSCKLPKLQSLGVKSFSLDIGCRESAWQVPQPTCCFQKQKSWRLTLSPLEGPALLHAAST